MSLYEEFMRLKNHVPVVEEVVELDSELDETDENTNYEEGVMLVEAIDGDPEAEENEIHEVEGLSLLLLTSSTDSKHNKMSKKNPTILKFEKYCKKNNIEQYTAFCDTAYLEKDEDGTIRIHNVGDDEGFVIDRDKTFVMARRSVLFHQYSSNLVEQLERYRFCFLNEIDSIKFCEDKMNTILKLQKAGIPTPKSALVPSVDLIEHAHEKIGGQWPVVVKTLNGTQGIGVFIINDYRSLKSTLQTMWSVSSGVELMIQEFIPASYDVRIHVVGDKCVAAMKRKVVDKDFRSNVHLGGKTGTFRPNEATRDIAIKATKAMRCKWAGVDIMFDKDGNPYVIEVNSSPGTDGIESIAKVDMTDIVMGYIKNNVNWHRPSQEIGVLEMVNVEGIGDIIARWDTGNSANSSSLDAQDISVSGNSVTWTTQGHKMKGTLVDTMKVKNNGGSDVDADKRVVVALNVSFDGVVYKDVLFNLNDRSHKTTPILMNKDFMIRSGSIVNPGKIYLVTQKPKVDKRKKKKEEKEDREEN